jgi:soluble lytic murein transglycosylase
MAYGSSLNSAGNYFVRKNDWITAARYYELLAGLFGQSEWGEQAHWRHAWAYYLQKDESNARRAFTEHLSRYPHSPHVPAALYWLGRLAESAGAFHEASQIYAALESRFNQSYYAAQARSRRASFGTASAGGSADFPQWSEVAMIAGQLRPLESPPVKFCAPIPPGESLRRFEALSSLGLDDLAEQFVKQTLADRPKDSDLILALSRLEAQEGDLASALLHMVRLLGNYTDFGFSALPKEIWELLYPRAYWDLVQKEARARGADAFLAMGLIRQESAFDPRAISSANARGLMQVLPQTAAHGRRQRRTAARRLLEPAYNIRVGMNYLEQLTKAFGGNMEEALAAYHAGEIRVSDWLNSRSYREPAEFMESIPIASTRAYVERVLRDAAIYRQLLTGSTSFADCRSSGHPTSEAGPASRKKNDRKPARATRRLQGRAGNGIKNQDRLLARNGPPVMFLGCPIS